MAALQQTLKALERYLSEIRPVVLVRGRRNECLFVYPHCTLVIKKVNQLRSRRMNVVGHWRKWRAHVRSLYRFRTPAVT